MKNPIQLRLRFNISSPSHKMPVTEKKQEPENGCWIFHLIREWNQQKFRSRTENVKISDPIFFFGYSVHMFFFSRSAIACRPTFSNISQSDKPRCYEILFSLVKNISAVRIVFLLFFHFKFKQMRWYTWPNGEGSLFTQIHTSGKIYIIQYEKIYLIFQQNNILRLYFCSFVTSFFMTAH